MSDFYPALARAAAKLAIDDALGRQELYQHARKCLVSLLQQQQPQRLAPEIVREQAALERAIYLVEEGLKRANCQPRAEAPSVDRRAFLDFATSAATLSHQERGIAEGDVGAVRTPVGGRSELKPSVESKIVSPRINEGISRTAMERQNRPAYRDTALIMLGCIVAVCCFAAVASIPIAAIYAPRLVWFVEHLVDNPRLIILIAAAFGLLIFLSLPIFGSRRKRTAFGFLWQLVFPILRADF